MDVECLAMQLYIELTNDSKYFVAGSLRDDVFWGQQVQMQGAQSAPGRRLDGPPTEKPM